MTGGAAAWAVPCSRKLHLHAARLQFEHPVTGKALRFSAPLPDHMARTWEMMGWREQDCPEELFQT